MFACGKKLTHAKKLVGLQANDLQARASEMDFWLFISEVEKQHAVLDPRDVSIRTGEVKKKRFYASKSMHAKRSLLM